MGYREYLYQVDKKFVEKIRACKTNEEYLEVVKAHIPDADVSGDYFPVYHLGKELFEFGKYYENGDEMYKHGDSLFQGEELRKEYADYNAIVLDESGLLCAIEWQQNRVLSVYEDLLREKSELNTFDKRTQQERMQDHIESHLRWWKFGACNLNKDSDHVASSWLYEHTIFDLVRIYKTFDWKNNCLIFAGW